MNSNSCQLFENAVKPVVLGSRGSPTPAVAAPENRDPMLFHTDHVASSKLRATSIPTAGITRRDRPLRHKRWALVPSRRALAPDPVELPRIRRCLCQEPLTERGNLWECRSRLGAYDPIGIFQCQSGLKRPDQATIDQVARSESGTGKCDPLTVDSGIDQHAGVIEDRAVQEAFSRCARHLQPSRPVSPVVQMQ